MSHCAGLATRCCPTEVTRTLSQARWGTAALPARAPLVAFPVEAPHIGPPPTHLAHRISYPPSCISSLIHTHCGGGGCLGFANVIQGVLAQGGGRFFLGQGLEPSHAVLLWFPVGSKHRVVGSHPILFVTIAVAAAIFLRYCVVLLCYFCVIFYLCLLFVFVLFVICYLCYLYYCVLLLLLFFCDTQTLSSHPSNANQSPITRICSSPIETALFVPFVPFPWISLVTTAPGHHGLGLDSPVRALCQSPQLRWSHTGILFTTRKFLEEYGVKTSSW